MPLHSPAVGPVCPTPEFVVPAALPRLRSKHRSSVYRTALRIECAAGDDNTIWIPKMSGDDQVAHRRSLDRLFGDAHAQQPKARHPWNQLCRRHGKWDTGAGAGMQLDHTIVPVERTVPAKAGKYRAEGAFQ